MFSPFLLVGVGGSGGKTLRTARADLQRRLDSLGWNEPFPDAWQFLHIDVPTVPDGLDPDLPGALPTGSYRGLVAGGVDYRTIDRILSQSLKSELDLAATAGWRPMATQVSVPIDRGAGQFRAIGRVITVTHLDAVKSAIEQAVGRLRGPEVKGQLKRVAALMGADDLQEMPEPLVLLVSSIAGGSGAGAVVDVTWALRAAGVSADQTVSILYAPDVFDSIPKHLRKGVRPNALATLSELCAAWWNDEGISAATNAMYNAEGLTVPQSAGGIPRMVLVGRRNQTVDYIEQNAVYVAMGRSISAWMSSEVVQDKFAAYFITNAASNTVTTVPDFPAALGHQTPPFRSIGFARVSLGRDLFYEYATQYLAREGVEVTLRKHHESRRGPDDDRTDRELVEEAARLAFRGFVIQSGLNERGPDNNDVLDALAPKDRREMYDTLAGNITVQIASGIPAGGRDINSVRSLIVSAAESLSPSYLAQEREGQRQMARTWVDKIQTRIMAATAASIARNGAFVTHAMLKKLVQEEVPFVVEELRHEGYELATWANDIDGSVQSQLAAAGRANLQASNPLIASAVSTAADCVYSRTEQETRELASSLLSDLASNFLDPLMRAVDHARQKLTDDEAPTGAVQSEVSLWPTGHNVPKRLRPSSNEFLLENPETFPDTLQNLLQRSVTDMSSGDAEGEVVAESISGASAVGEADQTLISAHRRWAPELAEIRGASQSPQRAQFAIALRAEDILARCQSWAKDRNRALGRYLSQSLEDYLSPEADTPEVISDRVRKFEGQFGAAVRAAEPLASIDTTMLQQLHGMTAPSSTYIYSVLPFADGSDARAAVTRVFDQTTGTREATFDDSDTSFIDVFALMDATLQPVVFDSLMRPIAEEWSSAKLNAEAREAFWRWRRARPLPEFIPLAPGIRRAMVRGWFTASLLKQLRLDTSQPLAVFDPESGGFAEFPFPLLQGDISLGYEYLPAVLKSLPLAWLECSTQRNLTPLSGYRRLRDLGGSGDSNSIIDYTINRTLQRWLSTGEAGPGAPVVDAAGATAEDRRRYAQERLTQWQNAYGKVFAETEKTRDPYKAPRAYELRDDIEGAFLDLRAGIDKSRDFDADTTIFN